MNTKLLFYPLALSLVATGALWSCDDDDDWPTVDGAAPVLQLGESHIKTQAGRTFTMTGKVTDNDGISTIRLECPALHLDKTIDIIDIYGEPLKEYDLDFKYPLLREETGDNFEVKVTVTDVAGQTTTQTILVTMDGDFAAPTITAGPASEVSLLMKAKTALTLNVSVSDDQALDYLTVQIPGIEGYETAKRFDLSGKTGSVSEKIVFPNEETSYTLSLVVVDKEGKQTQSQSLITVTSETPDYDHLYIADVTTADQLNADVFGKPLRVNHVYEVGADGQATPIPYTYEAWYYNQKAGQEVWLLGQKNDMGPVCYGVSADDPTSLNDDEDSWTGIKLAEAGVYYKIVFNIKTYSIASIETFAPDQLQDASPHDYGTESLDTWFDGGSWLQTFTFGYLYSNPETVVSFMQDATNKHLFYLEEPLMLEAGSNMNFYIHNWHSHGWWDYCSWKVAQKEDPEGWTFCGSKKNPDWTEWPAYAVSGGLDWAKPAVNVTGNYRLWFDAFLEQAWCEPVK